MDPRKIKKKPPHSIFSDRIYPYFLLVMLILTSPGWSPILPAGNANADKDPGKSQPIRRGTVTITMNSGGYTYIKIAEKGKNFWAAAREFDISTGDEVEFLGGMLMKNFHSKTLNRTFDEIWFLTNIRKSGESGPGNMDSTVPLPPGHIPIGSTSAEKSPQNKLPAGHIPIGKIRDSQAKIVVKPGDVKKAAEGYTVDELYRKGEELNGQTVTLRAVVVKFRSKILGRNWLHLQDGTGEKGSDDLTVTSTATVNPGDLVLVKGILAVNKDFGAGYVYRIIVEKAEIEIEETAK